MSGSAQTEAKDGLRSAFKRFMDEHGVSASDIARRAKLSTPNALYNFLNGRSKSLSRETLAAIADGFPGVTIDQLSGRRVPTVPPPDHKAASKGNKTMKPVFVDRLFVLLEVVPGEWRNILEFDPSMAFNLPMPVPRGIHFAGAFGAILRAPGASIPFSNGTILVCLSVLSGAAALTDGAFVLLTRMKGDLKQLSIRQIERKGYETWLYPRSTHIADQSPVLLPPLDDVLSAWSVGREKYRLHSVIVGAYSQFYSIGI